MMMKSVKLLLLVTCWTFVLELLTIFVSGSPLVVKTRTYSYSVHRPDQCEWDDDHFANCYLCGKLTDEKEIYYGCCAEREAFIYFCDRLLL